MTTPSTNSRSWSVRFGPNNSSADSLVCQVTSSSSTTFGTPIIGLVLVNRNATNAQITNASATCAVTGVASAAPQTFTVDTTAQTFVTFTVKNNTSNGDTQESEYFIVEYLPIAGN